eukprot:UN24914
MKQYLDSQNKDIPEFTIKKLMYELIEGLLFCQRHRIFHRDLKPQNILISKELNLKIADFGLGREHGIPIGAFTHEVVTLWYRAPELLLGQKIYSGAIDMWSVACIMAEFYTQEALFMGDCEIDQIFQIFKILGTPDDSVWSNVTKLPEYSQLFPQWKKQPFKNISNRFCKEAIDLLEKMLEYDPVKRITTKDALNHPYFAGFNSLGERKLKRRRMDSTNTTAKKARKN